MIAMLPDRRSIVAVALFLALSAIAQRPPSPNPDSTEFSVHDHTELRGFVGDERTLRWQNNGGAADWNELRIYHVETGLLAHSDDVLGSSTSYRWTPQRTGHYWWEMRACVLDDPETPVEGDLFCTVWADSRDPTYTIDAFPRGFQFFFIIRPPTDGGIEQ